MMRHDGSGRSPEGLGSRLGAVMSFTTDAEGAQASPVAGLSMRPVGHAEAPHPGRDMAGAEEVEDDRGPHPWLDCPIEGPLKRNPSVKTS